MEYYIDCVVGFRFTEDRKSPEIKMEYEELKELHIHSQNTYASQRSTTRHRLVLGREHHIASSLQSPSMPGSSNQHENNRKICSIEHQITEAIEKGDVETVTSLLEKNHEEQTTAALPDLVERAVCHDDYEMLRVLLQHYQNQLKSNTKRTSLDNHYNCLTECVYKDNPLMTKIIADAFVDAVRDSREIIFEKLLIASIKRCCSKSLIRDISRLWKSSFAIPNAIDSLVDAYTSILKNVRNDLDQNDGIYVYTLFSLNLLDFNKNSGKVLLDRLPKEKVEKVLKHKAKNSLDSYSNRPCLNFLLSQSGSLDEFLKWHKVHNGLQRMIMNAAITMIRETIQNEEEEEDDEVNRIRNDVDQFMRNLCMEIHKIDSVLQCTPNRVGSAQEQTRNFHPDEFDYELVFQELPRFFKPMKYENSIFFQLTASPDDLASKRLRSWLYEFNQHWYLNPDLFKETLNDIIQKTLTDSKSNLRYPFHTSDVDIQLSSSGSLCVEPFGNFIEKVKFSCIKIVYFGDEESKRKDLSISIDLIPTLECDLGISLPPHYLIESVHDRPHQKTHIIAFGDPLGFQIGFSTFENQVINALPRNLKNGYK